MQAVANLQFFEFAQIAVEARQCVAVVDFALEAEVARLREALTDLEGKATRLSNHDRIKQPCRTQSDWGKLHASIDKARAALNETTEDGGDPRDNPNSVQLPPTEIERDGGGA